MQLIDLAGKSAGTGEIGGLSLKLLLSARSTQKAAQKKTARGSNTGAANIRNIWRR
jgi:hypothetical protein